MRQPWFVVSIESLLHQIQRKILVCCSRIVEPIPHNNVPLPRGEQRRNIVRLREKSCSRAYVVRVMGALVLNQHELVYHTTQSVSICHPDAVLKCLVEQGALDLV